ncbi:alpha-amylase family glycosyl hydrolase [soil metagenome]
MLTLLRIVAIALLIAAAPATQSVPPDRPYPDPPAWVRDLTMYEVNLRQFSESGNLEGFGKQLPRLKELGVGVLWFMPLHPIGIEARSGTLGSPYAVRNYTAFNPEFGNIDQFKAVVDEAHRMGMYVIIDWVANHTAPDHPWVKQHPDWYTRDKDGQLVHPTADWKDVVDLNFGVQDMRAEMIDAMAFWVRNTGIDGFRCDAAAMVPLDFWVDARNALRKIRPVFLLGEGVETNLMDHAFDATYAWYLTENIEGIAQGKKTVSDLANYLNADARVVANNGFRLNFTTNHDKNSWEMPASERFGKGLDAFTVLTFTVPGMSLIYNGQEAGLDRRLKFFEHDPITWRDDPAAKLYRTLAKLKRDHPALWTGSAGGKLHIAEGAAEAQVLCFEREVGDDRVVVMLNLSGASQRAGAPKGVEKLNEVFGQKIAMDADGKILLDAWSYRVWASGR